MLYSPLYMDLNHANSLILGRKHALNLSFTVPKITAKNISWLYKLSVYLLLVAFFTLLKINTVNSPISYVRYSIPRPILGAVSTLIAPFSAEKAYELQIYFKPVEIKDLSY